MNKKVLQNGGPYFFDPGLKHNIFGPRSRIPPETSSLEPAPKVWKQKSRSQSNDCDICIEHYKSETCLVHKLFDGCVYIVHGFFRESLCLFHRDFVCYLSVHICIHIYIYAYIHLTE